MVKNMPKKFRQRKKKKLDHIDKWFKSELKKELRKVPKGIREIAKKDKNAEDIVCDSVARKAGLNPKSKNIKKICRILIRK